MGTFVTFVPKFAIRDTSFDIAWGQPLVFISHPTKVKSPLWMADQCAGRFHFFWLQHATFNRPVLVRPVKPAKERFLHEAQSSESHRVGLGEQY